MKMQVFSSARLLLSTWYDLYAWAI